MKRKFTFLLYLSLGITATAAAQLPANHILELSKNALGLNHMKKPVLHYYYNEVVLAREQSDRAYPPFFTTAINGEAWMNVPGNMTCIKADRVGPGSGPGDVKRNVYTGVSKFYSVKDTALTAGTTTEYDKMNAWTVLLDWAADPQVKQLKNEVYRDYDRLVFERPALDGTERLLIDPKTYFPVKLDYRELSSLWGQQHVEIVYSLWSLTEGCFLPLASFRLEDGEKGPPSSLILDRKHSSKK